MKILDAKDILSLSIEVTEEIASKSLLDFLRNAILESGHSCSKQTMFYYYYVAVTHTYEVIFYEKDQPNIILEPLLLGSYCSSKKQTKVIYTQNYFTIFTDNTLIVFKPMQGIVKEDMQIYVEQMYKIESFEIIALSDSELEHFVAKSKTNNLAMLQINEYLLYERRGFLYFSLFVVSIAAGLGGYFYQQSLSLEKQMKIEPIVVEKKSDLAPVILPIDTLVELFDYLVEHKVTIDKISYANSKINTVLYSNEKDNILHFITKYKKNIRIKSWNFDKRTNTYSLEVMIAI